MARQQTSIAVISRKGTPGVPLTSRWRDGPDRPPFLTVILVNYRQWEETTRLVEQLRRSPRLQEGEVEVVVVDNHSPPHRLLRRMRRLDGVSLRRWGRNRGFARAVNEGWRLSRGKWLLLINSDVTVSPRFLEEAVACARRLESDPSAGIVGFGLRNEDGTRQWSTGSYPTLWSTLSRLVLPRSQRKYDCQEGDRPRTVSWVTGCCVMIREACMRDLKGLDRDFFLYYEDVDLCHRAAQRGWSVRYDPTVEVIHHSPLHSRQPTPLLRLLTRHALMTYARKHWAPWQGWVLSQVIGLEAKLRRTWLAFQGDESASRIFEQLQRLAEAMGAGRHQSAWQQLWRLLRDQEPPTRLGALRERPGCSRTASCSVKQPVRANA